MPEGKLHQVMQNDKILLREAGRLFFKNIINNSVPLRIRFTVLLLYFLLLILFFEEIILFFYTLILIIRNVLLFLAGLGAFPILLLFFSWRSFFWGLKYIVIFSKGNYSEIKKNFKIVVFICFLLFFNALLIIGLFGSDWFPRTYFSPLFDEKFFPLYWIIYIIYLLFLFFGISSSLKRMKKNES